jgi:hypothetical protein
MPRHTGTTASTIYGTVHIVLYIPCAGGKVNDNQITVEAVMHNVVFLESDPVE